MQRARFPMLHALHLVRAIRGCGAQPPLSLACHGRLVRGYSIRRGRERERGAGKAKLRRHVARIRMERLEGSIRPLHTGLFLKLIQA